MPQPAHSRTLLSTSLGAALCASAGLMVPLAVALLPRAQAMIALVAAALVFVLGKALARGGAWRRWALASLALSLTAACAARLSGWWPCDVACQGGAHYQALGGISIVWPALAAYAWFAALALRDARRGQLSPWLTRYAWLLFGVNVFFAWIAYRLELHCPFCSFTHLAMLVAILVCWPLPGAVRWCAPLSWGAFGFLLVNAVFHHRPQADAVAARTGDDVAAFMHVGGTPKLALPAAERALYDHADANRCQGVSDAPLAVELVIDFQCDLCAQLHAPLLDALRPAIVAGRVRLITRHLVRPSENAGRDLVRLALAASALDAASYRGVASALLGSNRDATFAGVRARLAEALDLAPLDVVLRDHAPAVERLVDDDLTRIAALGVAGKTPTVLLIDRATGRELGRWQGRFAASAVTDAVNAAR